jgi:uncharacterized protein YbaR (Trm112 family)
MTVGPELESLLACPRCDQPLAAAGASYRCAGCRVDFPLIAGLPWLFAEPTAALVEWRSRWRLALQRNDRTLAELKSALDDADLKPATRERLTRLAAATEDHGRRLGELLAPLMIERAEGAYETYLALRTRLPPEQGLTTYYANAHRDWAWGDAENSASLAIVSELLAGADPKRQLVLGAGAGRLAYDLHVNGQALITAALDFNPLLLLIGARVAAGQTLELHEFPIAPRSTADQAVLRTLAAPAPARSGLHYLAADVHRAPLRPGSFDAVVTPWLIDILPESFDALCTRVNVLLAPSGCWLNFGSLSFHDADPRLRYGLEECRAALADSGFGDLVLTEHEIPYMCSPASRHGRRERVVAWSARKHVDVKRPPRHQALPEWLVRGADPVPLSESFRMQAVSTRIHAFIMSLIDGRRSLKDIAKVLIDQRLLGREEAEPTIRAFLIKMYDDSRRGSTY